MVDRQQTTHARTRVDFGHCASRRDLAPCKTLSQAAMDRSGALLGPNAPAASLKGRVIIVTGECRAQAARAGGTLVVVARSCSRTRGAFSSSVLVRVRSSIALGVRGVGLEAGGWS